LLQKKIRDLPAENFWVRLMPPNYLYPKNSRREAHRHGINYSLDISDYIEHAVYFDYRDDAREELIRLATNKKVIIDVGVNIGAMLLSFARLIPNGMVIGFEPDAKNFLKARENLKLNDFGNVRIIQKGLGEEAATVKLFRVNEGNEGMNRILSDAEHALEKDFAFDEIEIVKLDDFADENKLDRIDLIKIDVEGYELKVLRGAEQVLRKYSPVLFIELDDDNLKAQNNSAQELILFLNEIGYDVRRADNKQKVATGDDFTRRHFDIICEK
jgi:FkbM family methyltransferase